MQDYFFYFFCTLALVSALLVVVNRNPVNSAMFMILTLLSIAGMFALPEAYFLAILQVLVYAGALMVLFLFIIMLIDVEGSMKRSTARRTIVAAVLSGLIMVAAVWALVDGTAGSLMHERVAVEAMPVSGDPLV